MFVNGACARIVSSPGASLIRRTSSSTACSGSGRCARLREERVAHPVLAVDVLGSHPLRDQRLARSRRRPAPRRRGRPSRRCRARSRSPARSATFPTQIVIASSCRLRMQQRDQQREDVVAGGVGVDDQAGHTATVRRSSSSRTRRQAGDHALVLDHVRAGRAAPAHRVEVGGALRERDRERRAERVARTGRVDRTRAGKAGTSSSPSRAPCSPSVTTSVPSAPLDGSSLGLVRRRGSRRPGAIGSRRRRRGVQDRAHAGRARRPRARAARSRPGSRAGRAGRRRRQSARRTRRRARASECASAPGTITIRLSPLASTRIAAVIVGRADAEHGARVDALALPRARTRRRRSGLRPTAVRKATSAPSRAAPTAWFDPLPPWSVPEERPDQRLSALRARAPCRTSARRRSSRRPRSASLRDLMAPPGEARTGRAPPRLSFSSAAEALVRLLPAIAVFSIVTGKSV